MVLSWYNPRSSELKTIGHFRVLLRLCFKTSLSTKPFIRKWVSFHVNQSHFHRNGFALWLALKQKHKGTRKLPINISNFGFTELRSCRVSVKKKDIFVVVPELSLARSTSGGKFNYKRLIIKKGRKAQLLQTLFLGCSLYFLEVELFCGRFDKVGQDVYQHCIMVVITYVTKKKLINKNC